MRATWSWGSRVKLIFDWGDGTSDKVTHTDNVRISEFTHVYQTFGTFYPNVRIWNYLIDCRNQTLYLTAGGDILPVNILIPILDFQISPVFTAWQRTIPFDLSITLENGTWINISIDWNDTTYSSIYMDVIPTDFQVLLFYDILFKLKTR